MYIYFASIYITIGVYTECFILNNRWRFLENKDFYWKIF